MINSKEKMACRVCGLIQFEAPWGDDGMSPNYEICSCCGVEFGYEDSSLKGVVTFRNKWLEGTTSWENDEEQPDNWDLEIQLKNVPLDFK